MTAFRPGDRHCPSRLQLTIGSPALQAGTAGRGAPPVADPEAGAAPDVRAEKPRVVIVEDEAVIAIEIEDILSSLGAEVVGIAMSAEQAVRLAEAERPACMTMDIRLQGERDGISAAIEIQERFGIRCIFVSAYSDADTVARGERARPLAWLSKPLRKHELQAALAGLGKNPGA